MANPIYQVIYDDLAVQIAEGALEPDARLPSESELADRYGVSRMTVRQALKQMENERLVIRRRGAGTFVAPVAEQFRTLNRLGPFEREIGLEGTRLRTQVLGRESLVPPDEVRERLGLKPRQAAILLSRLRIVDDRPAALQRSWIPYALAPGLVREELIDGSLYRTLLERHGVAVQWAEQEIRGVLADEELAVLLDVAIGSPLTANKRLTYAVSGPVELAYGWTRPEFPLLIRLEA
jgi:GntR family transcriptional regulator